MDSGIVGILVLLGVSVVVGAFCHAFIRSFTGACTTTALCSTVLFQCAAYLELGYLDPFALIAFFVGAFFALIISIPVGLITRSIRRRRHLNSTPLPKRRTPYP